ncbi:MAG: hypothetical protein ABI625_03110 [bacterium]
MTEPMSTRFSSPRQVGSRQHAAGWAAPLGALKGHVCVVAIAVNKLDRSIGTRGYRLPQIMISAGFVGGGRTP